MDMEENGADNQSTNEMMDEDVITIDSSNDGEDEVKIKNIVDFLSKFYLKLECDYILPCSTVQKIACDIKTLTQIVHKNLIKNLTRT